jgi:hypothetical protein
MAGALGLRAPGTIREGGFRMNESFRKELQTLIQTAGGPCVSLFMPTVKAGDTQQNSIRYKNLLRSAAERLEERGLRSPEADALLEPAKGLVNDYSFWEHQDEGLAVFRSRDLFRTFRLPMDVRELAVVEERFHLKPLFPMLHGDGRFYILALSLKNVRLIEANRHSAREVDLDAHGVPTSREEALGTLTRSFIARGNMNGGPMFFGHGAAEDDLKAEIVNYFNRVDDALAKAPIDRSAPFVLAGVEYLLPRYKDATELPNVLEEGLTGNFEGVRAEELQQAAWPIVEPLFLDDQKRQTDRYGELAGSGRASSRLEEILPAAYDGRVEALFTARGVRVWGSYDPESREARFEEEQNAQTNGSEDLIDLAAIQSYIKGGKIFAVEQQYVPEGKVAAAIFRW